MRFQFSSPLLLSILTVWLLGATPRAAYAQVVPLQAKTQPGTKTPPAHQTRPIYWTKHWSFQDVDVKRFLSRLESIGVEIPVAAAGEVSVEIDVWIPVNRLTDAKAYRLRGQIQSSSLRLESLLLQDFGAEFYYEEGILRLAELMGRWTDADLPRAGGSFGGNASAQLVPQGDFRAVLTADSLQLAPIQKLLTARSSDRQAMTGSLSGKLDLSVPLDRLRQVDAWHGAADLQIDNWSSGGVTPISARTGPVKLRDGVLFAQRIELVSADSSENRIDLAAQVELTDKQRFEFRIRGNDVPLPSLAALAVQDARLVEGKLDIDVQGQGELSSESWSISGRVGSPALTIAGQNLGLFEHRFEFDQERFALHRISDDKALESRILFDQVLAEYQLREDSLEVTGIAAKLLGGTLRGNARFARRDGDAHALRLDWSDLHAVVDPKRFLPIDDLCSAVASGAMVWSAQSGSLSLPASHQGSVRLELDRIRRVRSNRRLTSRLPRGETNFNASPSELRTGSVRVTLEANDGRFQLTGIGKVLGGNFAVEAASETGDEDDWSALLARAPEGYAKAESIDVNAIANAFDPNSPALRGSVSAELEWQAGARTLSEMQPTLNARFRDLALDGRSVSRRFTTRIRYADGALKLDRTSGSFASGSFRANGIWSLSKGERRVQVGLASIQADQTLRLLSEKVATQIGGKVSGKVTMMHSDRLRFRGAMTAHDSHFFSVPTGTVHSGIHGFVSNDLRRWEIGFPSVQGQLASGRITGAAKLSSSSIRPGAFDLSSRWDANRLDFGQLLAAAGVSSRVAHGRMTGQLALAGRGIRGASDLTGRFDARLDATQAAAIPGLLQADQFLGLLSLQGLQFDEGAVSGVIGTGAATIDELRLSSPRIKVWSQGKIYFANQRMDLDSVIATSNFGFGGSEAVAFASQLAIQSVLPVTTLLEVNRILSNRTVHLEFLGTLSDPRVKLKPLETIREEAANFLLRELLVAASVSNSL